MNLFADYARGFSLKIYMLYILRTMIVVGGAQIPDA